MKLTDEQILEIEQRANKASKGPWRAEYEGRQGYYTTFFRVGPAILEGVPDDPTHPAYRSLLDALKPKQRDKAVARAEQQWADIDFIGAARTDVPALVEDLKEARQALKVLQKAVDEKRITEAPGAAHNL